MTDGSIIIDTRIDTGGVSKGMNAVKAGMTRISAQVSKMGDSAKSSFQRQITAITDLYQNYEKQERKVSELKSKLEELSKVRIETEEYKKLKDDIKALEDEFEKVETKQREWLDMGFSIDSAPLQELDKQMDDICWYFLPFQNEDGQMLVWAYEAIVAAVALVIVLVQGRRQKIAGRTLETGLTIISVMQVLLDSWRADELIRFGFVRLNMLMAALTLAVLLASRLTRCIRRDGLKGISIARIVMLLAGAGVCIAVEFALDKSAINNGILYGVMMLALVPMFIAVLLDDGRIQTAEERK